MAKDTRRDDNSRRDDRPEPADRPSAGRRDDDEHALHRGSGGPRHEHRDQYRPYGYGQSAYGQRGAADRYGYGFDEGRAQPSPGHGEDWSRRAWGADEQPGPHRGNGPRGYRRSDERIREDVCDVLTEDTHLDASDIDVAVKDGEVTLTGTVASRADKRAAEDMAERSSGVKHVQNSLRVQGS